MIKSGILILLFFLTSVKSFGQSDIVISEEIKVLLFSSIELDGNNATKEKFKNWSDVRENHYMHLEIISSAKESLYKPDMIDSIMGKYEIQIYKLPSYNSENQSRYLMKYSDFKSEVWLRIGGYVENDLHLLFCYFRAHKINKKHLKNMIKEWGEIELFFNEIDWMCLYKGYIKGSTKNECFKSAYYILKNDVSIGFDPINNDNLNSTFSRIPLYGRFK